jgi:O-antigen/teichoic acid export membrane protein
MIDRRIIGNFFNLLVGAGLSKGLYLIAVIIAARALGPNEWGAFSYTFAILAVLHIVSDFGFHTLIMRDTAAGLFDKRLLWRITCWRIAFGAIAAIGTFIWLRASDTAVQLQLTLLFLTLSILFRAYYSSVRSVLLGLERPKSTVVLDVVLFGGFLAFVVMQHWAEISSPETTALAWLMSTIFCALVALSFQRRVHFQELVAKSVRNTSVSLIRKARPFLLINALVIAFHRIDILMLKEMRDIADVGYYAVAYQLFEALVLIPGLLSIALFPKMVKENQRSSGSMMIYAGTSAMITGIVSLACWFVADSLVLILFGAFYQASGEVLTVLLIGLPFMAITTTVAHGLFSKGRETASALSTATALSANIVLNLHWIPEFGMVGAAWATAVALILNSILHIACGAYAAYAGRNLDLAETS